MINLAFGKCPCCKKDIALFGKNPKKIEGEIFCSYCETKLRNSKSKTLTIILIMLVNTLYLIDKGRPYLEISNLILIAVLLTIVWWLFGFELDE